MSTAGKNKVEVSKSEDGKIRIEISNEESSDVSEDVSIPLPGESAMITQKNSKHPTSVTATDRMKKENKSKMKKLDSVTSLSDAEQLRDRDIVRSAQNKHAEIDVDADADTVPEESESDESAMVEASNDDNAIPSTFPEPEIALS